jgi:hypothetical protein
MQGGKSFLASSMSSARLRSFGPQLVGDGGDQLAQNIGFGDLLDHHARVIILSVNSGSLIALRFATRT